MSVSPATKSFFIASARAVPVKLTIQLAASVHRDLVIYPQALARETGGGPIPPAKLIGPMLARFMATDRAFGKLRTLGADE